MNIKSLRAFRHVISTGSLSGASNKLHLSISAISRLISALEHELKLELFSRDGRRLTPTREGTEFYRETGRILDSLDEIERIASDIRENNTARLRVVIMPRMASVLVSPVIQTFRKQNPKIKLSLDVRSRRYAERWLIGSEYDFGIGALPIEHPDITTDVLIKAKSQALIPVGHPLANKNRIKVEDLAEQYLIALMPGLLLRTQVDDIFRSAGISKSFDCEVASSQLACNLVADGVGITIADSLTIDPSINKKVVLKPISPERWMSFGLLFPKSSEVSNNAKQLIKLLKNRANTLSKTDPSLQA